MKIRITICLLFLAPLFAQAQSVEEIQKIFPGEEAVMLNASMQYTISIKDNKPYVESEENQQIKYLSSQAAGYMTRYGFVHSDFQQVIKYEAFTITADNKKLKVNDYKTNDMKDGSVFYDDVKQTSFDFPAIAPGCVGSLQVSRVHKEAHLLSPFFFSAGIPVLNSELKIKFPKEIKMKYQLLGTDTAAIQVTKETRRGENTYTFRCINIPASKKYGDAPDNSWYANHVVFCIEAYTNDKGENVPFLSTLDDLYRISYGYIKDVNKEITPATKAVVDSCIKNVSSDEQKARNIYRWVQQHIKYVAFEEGMEGFVPRDANLVCNRRFGDCKDMASILTLMLRQAGLQAYFTWIGTRNLAYKFTETPLPMVSNHMICTLLLNGKYIFLDGTHPTCIFGIPPDGIQDKEAMIAINEKEYKILKVPVADKTSNVLTDSTFLDLSDNKVIQGKIKLYNRGYFSMDEHARLMYADESNLKQRWRNKLSRGSNKFQLDSLNIVNDGDLTKFNVSAAFSLPDYAKKIGDEWYINLNLFKFYEHEEIDYPKRKMPIEYDYKYTKAYVTTLTIPAGYHVGYMPPNKTFHNDIWGFSLQYQQQGNKLILTQEFDNNSLLLQPSQFSDWNKVLENLFPQYKETIILSKN